MSRIALTLGIAIPAAAIVGLAGIFCVFGVANDTTFSYAPPAEFSHIVPPLGVAAAAAIANAALAAVALRIFRKRPLAILLMSAGVGLITGTACFCIGMFGAAMSHFPKC